MKRICLFTGISAPLLYAFTVILGGILWSDYNHFSDAISELTATEAPYRLPLNILFSISLVLATLFAVTAFLFVGRFGNRLLKAGMTILIAITVLSFLWAFFPMDPRGEEITVRGMVHLILAGIVSPMTIISPILVGLGFRKIQVFRGYAVYSLISATLILVTGLMAVLSVQSNVAYLGLFERLTIGSYQQWMGISALVFYRQWGKNLESI